MSTEKEVNKKERIAVIADDLEISRNPLEKMIIKNLKQIQMVPYMPLRIKATISLLS